MKKYQYVKVIGLNFIQVNFMDHRKIIDEYGLKGFRYVGFIPTKIYNNGQIGEIDLIFEQDV